MIEVRQMTDGEWLVLVDKRGVARHSDPNRAFKHAAALKRARERKAAMAAIAEEDRR